MITIKIAIDEEQDIPITAINVEHTIEVPPDKHTLATESALLVEKMLVSYLIRAQNILACDMNITYKDAPEDEDF